MRYRIYLILFIIYLAGFQPASAQDARYRVELLVLRHLNGVAELEPQSTLRNFSAAMDLLEPQPEEVDEEMPGAGGELPQAAAPAVEAIAADQGGLEEVLDEPNEEAMAGLEAEPQVVLLDTQSEVMQRAWQRLRSSSGYRPELYLSWEQAEVEPFPSIRVHDQDVLIEDDSWTDLRASAENAGEETKKVPAFTDTTTPVSGLLEHEGSDMDEHPEVISGPIRYYRIDGTASLRKTRFLHLDLDLEFREALYADGGQDNTNRGLDAQHEEKPRPSTFLVHTLQQNRQVQTQGMEYFDGPVLAVLATVSRVQAVTKPDPEAVQSSE